MNAKTSVCGLGAAQSRNQARSTEISGPTNGPRASVRMPPICPWHPGLLESQQCNFNREPTTTADTRSTACKPQLAISRKAIVDVQEHFLD